MRRVVLFVCLLLTVSACAPTRSETAAVSPTDTATPTTTTRPPLEYVVVAGDTCLSIAGHFHILVQSIIIENNLHPSCNNLVVGQKLKLSFLTSVPTPMPVLISCWTPAPDGVKVDYDHVIYTVQGGDTLDSLATKLSSNAKIIKDFNGLDGDELFVGQVLYVPQCR